MTKFLTQKQLVSFRRWLYIDQKRKCLICDEVVPIDNFVVDHDHRTGNIRGGLCSNCNLVEGLLKDKNSTLAPKIARYISADYSANAIYPGFDPRLKLKTKTVDVGQENLGEQTAIQYLFE